MNDAKDLLQRLGRVGARIAPELTDRDIERLVDGGLRRRRRKTVARGTITAALVGCLAGLLVVMRAPRSQETMAPVAVSTPTSAPAVPSVHLSDGSVATPLETTTVLHLLHDAPDQVVLDLARGRARFEVVSRPERLFLIHAGEVIVSVVGTTFTVERVADRVGVAVERGTVRVDWGTGREDLSDGHSGWYPPLVIRPFAPTPADVRPPQPKPRTPAGAAAFADPSGQETADTLLQAADHARVEGRADEGAALLRRLLREHRGDPRAPLAAFTLGRVLLIELGQPRQAALAFAQVRALAPGNPLAEDALAREVEAWKRSGDPALARARAEEYLWLYPKGLRADAVRALGQVE
jgi:transmembrane sensor